MNASEIITEFGTPLKTHARYGAMIETSTTSHKWPLIALAAGVIIGGVLVYHWSAKQRDQFQTEVLTKLSDLQSEVRQNPIQKQWESMKEENMQFMNEVRGLFGGSKEI